MHFHIPWHGPFEEMTPKKKLLDFLLRELAALGFIDVIISEKPWGVEVRIDQDQTSDFLARFFEGLDIPDQVTHQPFGPNLMLIEEGHRLSWHYHERKIAFLVILHGSIIATTSQTDRQELETLYASGETILVPAGIRHRLKSTRGWGVVAEIATHHDPAHPTDPTDTVRLEDDYGRQEIGQPIPVTHQALGHCLGANQGKIYFRGLTIAGIDFEIDVAEEEIVQLIHPPPVRLAGSLAEGRECLLIFDRPIVIDERGESEARLIKIGLM